MTVSAARAAAFEVLHRMERQGTYSHVALRDVLESSRLQPNDAGLASEIVHGVTLWRRLLEHWLLELSGGKSARSERVVVIICLMSLYQLRMLTRVPSYAVVDDAVTLTRMHAERATGFVNAVLRASLRQTDYLRPITDLSMTDGLSLQEVALRLSYPDWLALHLQAALGAEAARSAMHAMNETPVRTLRVNRLRCTREQLIEALAQEGVTAVASPISPDGVRLTSRVRVETMSAFARGWCTLQGESSMLLAQIVDPVAGERVLDACAAPGAKATHLAEYSGDEAVIVAVEIYDHRSRMITALARRLGIGGVQVVTGDARAETGLYDAVLLDAPCSGLGTIARKSDIKWSASSARIGEVAKLQSELLRCAALRVRPGGRLIYSTCTLSPEENDRQRDRFLAEHPEFSPKPLTLTGGWSPSESLAQRPRVGELKVLPQDFGGDGFYIASFVRT